MKKLFLLAILSTPILFAGCNSGGAKTPVNTTKFNAEDHHPFVLLDKQVQRSVTSPGISQRVLPDGRLEVIANVRNREIRRIQVQINCVFKDENGFSTGDETPFRTLILDENAQESVQFVSMNDRARKYTIRVRQAR